MKADPRAICLPGEGYQFRQKPACDTTAAPGGQRIHIHDVRREALQILRRRRAAMVDEAARGDDPIAGRCQKPDVFALGNCFGEIIGERVKQLSVCRI